MLFLKVNPSSCARLDDLRTLAIKPCPRQVWLIDVPVLMGAGAGSPSWQAMTILTDYCRSPASVCSFLWLVGHNAVPADVVRRGRSFQHDCIDDGSSYCSSY
jgi:hypothetical protein